MAPTFQMTVRKDWPELGDQWVVIRNPLIAPSDKKDLRPVKRDSNGELDPIDFAAAVDECAAGLVVDWHVYDLSSLDDKPALIPIGECNAATIRSRVMGQIRDWILGERVALVPQESQEQTSSTPGSNP